MATKFDIVEARLWHTGQMARLLRFEHHRALTVIGADAHRELRLGFEDSSYCRSWLIDGRLAAIGGVRATALSPLGYVWLALTDEACRHPIALVKEGRRQIAHIMRVKRELATTLIEGDDAARRFAVFMGFHVAHDGVGDAAVSRAGRRMLLESMNTYSERRVRVGKGYAVAVGYHEETA